MDMVEKTRAGTNGSCSLVLRSQFLKVSVTLPPNGRLMDGGIARNHSVLVVSWSYAPFFSFNEFLR